MSESQAIGIRLENKFLKSIDELSDEEHFDRSTTMRILLKEGYKNHIIKKAAEEYKAGRITMSKGAEKAKITIFEFEKFLVSNGFKSQYSVEDLKEELSLFK